MKKNFLLFTFSLLTIQNLFTVEPSESCTTHEKILKADTIPLPDGSTITIELKEVSQQTENTETRLVVTRKGKNGKTIEVYTTNSKFEKEQLISSAYYDTHGIELEQSKRSIAPSPYTFVTGRQLTSASPCRFDTEITTK